MGREDVDIWVENKTKEGDDDYESRDNPIEEDRPSKFVSKFCIEESGAERNRKNEPAFQDRDHLGSASFGGHDKRVLHSCQDSIGHRYKKF